MTYILDTHIFLWWLEDSPKLSKTTKEIIANPSNIIVISTVSFWEIVIKAGIKKLTLKKKGRLKDLLTIDEFPVLSVKIEHIRVLAELPPFHKDPFDRMLIAQAKSENIKLLTDDKKITAYF